MATKDTFFYSFYWVSWSIVAILGIIGFGFAFFLLGGTSIDLGDLQALLDPEIIIPVSTTLVMLIVSCFVMALVAIAFVSKLGEELILLVFWITPFVLAAVSAYLVYDTGEIDYAGGMIIAVVFLGLVIYFRKSLRASARLVELGAEIVITNPKMFYPAIIAMILKFIATILMLSGSILLIGLLINIHPIVAIIAWVIYEFLFLYVMGVITSFSQATNIAYVLQWYSSPSKSPSLGTARGRVAKLKSPIARYSFLMTFIRAFKRNSSSNFTPFSLFKGMKISNWGSLLKGGLFSGGIGNTVARVIEYLGIYTLIIIVSKNLRSVTDAYKESAKGVFNTFVTNIAGQIGLNIVNIFQGLITSILLLIVGFGYGYGVFPILVGDPVGSLIYAIVFAIIFLIVGSIPIGGLFKPVITSYQYVLYQTYIDSKSSKALSSRLDKKTQAIIKSSFKK